MYANSVRRCCSRSMLAVLRFAAIEDSAIRNFVPVSLPGCTTLSLADKNEKKKGKTRLILKASTKYGKYDACEGLSGRGRLPSTRNKSKEPLSWYMHTHTEK